jgi:hypothetical protein
MTRTQRKADQVAALQVATTKGTDLLQAMKELEAGIERSMMPAKPSARSYWLSVRDAYLAFEQSFSDLHSRMEDEGIQELATTLMTISDKDGI